MTKEFYVEKDKVRIGFFTTEWLEDDELRNNFDKEQIAKDNLDKAFEKYIIPNHQNDESILLKTEGYFEKGGQNK